MTILFATLARKEQLPDTLLLADSLKKHHPDARIALCLVDTHLPARQLQRFDEVLLLSGRGLPTEDAWNSGPAKAYFIRYLLHHYTGDIVYLDPETVVYGPLSEVLSRLRRHHIIVVPHNLEPYCKDRDHLEITRLQEGFIHPGFLAVRNSDRSRRFISWWGDRVEQSVYGPTPCSFADQLWLSLGIVPFDIHIMKEPGYHLAPWNWHESVRSLHKEDDEGVQLTNGKRLRTFLTAGVKELREHSPPAASGQTRSALKELLRRRAEELSRVRHSLKRKE